ncbi:MAG: HEAT repeat domain-containing protein [Myxococcota bacterium]
MRSIAQAVLVLLLVTACSTPADPTTAPYWIARLGDRQERTEALTQLGKIGDKQAVPAVRKWFETPGEWQPAAAYTLGQLGDPSVVPQLVAALNPSVGSGRDRDTNIKNRVNINAARALAMLGAKQAAPDLLKLLSVPDNGTREAAIGSLGMLGNPIVVEPLIGVARDEQDPFVRKAAVEALGHLGDRAAVPVLVRMLFAEPEGVSFYGSARLALIQLGAPAEAALLATLVRRNDDIETMRQGAGEPLPAGVIEAKAASVLGAMHAATAREAIISTLDKLDKQLKRGGAAKALKPVVVELLYASGMVGGTGSARVLLPFLRDADADIRIAAMEAMTTAGDASAVGALLQAARSGPPEARLAAIVAASRLGDGSHLAAFDGLGASVGNDTETLLAEAVAAERVRLVAAGACKRDVACWRSKLGDSDIKVRERASFELGWLGAKAAIADLMKVAQDADPQVRMAAVMSIGRLGGANPDELQRIYDAWDGKAEYAAANAELRTTIARLRQKRS